MRCSDNLSKSNTLISSIHAGMTETSKLEEILLKACQDHNPEQTGFLPVQKLSRALQDADLGLTKFQITMLVADAEQRDQGVEYQTFISRYATNAISLLVDTEEKMQHKRAKAWKEVRKQASQRGESFDTLLGLTRADFSKMMSEIFLEADEDKSGLLQHYTFKDCLRRSGIELSNKEIKMLMASAEIDDESGLLQYSKFSSVAFILIQQIMQEKHINAKMKNKLITRAYHTMTAFNDE